MPKVPKMLQAAPLTSLRQSDIESLSGVGWTIRPPAMQNENPEDELFRLTMEQNGINKRVIELMTNGAKIIPQEEITTPTSDTTESQ